MSAALTFGFAVPFALILLVLLVVVVLVDRRDDLDPEGRRPFAAYVFVVVFLTLFTTLFALAAMVGSLVHLATSDDDTKESQNTPSAETFTAQGPSGPIVSDPSRDTTLTDADDAHIRDAVRAGLLAAAAGGVLFFHLGMARTAAEDSVARAAPARRVYHAYLYAATTLAVVIVVGAATAFGYGIFKVIAPGVASSSGVGKRTSGLPDLSASAVLIAGAAFIFSYHFRRRPNGVRGAVAALPPAPDAFAPPPAPAPEPEPPGPPAKRPARKAPAAKKTASRRTRRAE